MEYITVKTAGELLGVSREGVRRLVKNGELKNHKMPFSKSILLDKGEVMAFKDKETQRDWFSRKQASEFLGISETLFVYYAKVYNVPFEKVHYGFERVRYKKSHIANLKKYIIKE